MTKIDIALRLRPFSHEVGAKFLLPGTTLCVQVFPTRLFLYNLEEKGDPVWIAFDWTGPVRDFTTQLDEEKGALCVFGQAKEGPVRYLIEVLEGEVVLRWEHRRPVRVSCPLFSSRTLSHHEQVSLGGMWPVKPVCQERVSLGCHKAQDVTYMKRRLDIKELLPHWLRVARWLPPVGKPKSREGNYALLDRCLELVERGERIELEEALESFFLSSFEGFFVPRLVDTDHQGLLPEEVVHAEPALSLLVESAACIRSLLLQEKVPGEVRLLPCLPPSFHCGRAVAMRVGQDQRLHVDWTKGALRMVIIESCHDAEIKLYFPKGISSCRRKGKKDNVGQLDIPRGGSLVFFVGAGERVVLDRFEG